MNNHENNTADKIFYPLKINDESKETISYSNISKASENSDNTKLNIGRLATADDNNLKHSEQNEVTVCLKSFYVNETNDGEGRLISALRHYALGPKDILKCTLCCFDRIDLSDMKSKNPNEKSFNKAEKENKQMHFCRKEILQEVALHILSFDPFCKEYCNQFYPNFKSDRIDNRNNNNTEIANEGSQKSITTFLNSLSSLTLNSISESLSSEHQPKQKICVEKYEHLIKCLKEFNYEEVHLNNKKLPNAELDFKNDNKQTKVQKKVPRLETEKIMKFKPLPLCKDKNGELHLSFKIPDHVSKRGNDAMSKVLQFQY